jgi:hypothetical protein
VKGPEGIQIIPEGGHEQENEPIDTPMKQRIRKTYLGWVECRDDFIMTGV